MRLIDFLPVRFEGVETDLAPVGKTADEGTAQLDELDDEEKYAQDGVHLGDAGLPEGEVRCQVLGWHCQDL